MAEVDLNQSGIYQIKNLIDNKIYIGSAVNFRKRWRLHRYQLNNNSHDNRHLQNAWNKYSSEAFEFKIIEIVDKSVLLTREQQWIEFTNCCEIGYNINKDVFRSRLGVKSSLEHVEKIRKANLGSKRSPETCIKIGLAKKGTRLTEERKRARRDYRHTEEAKQKIASRRGWKHSEEAKAKMSSKAKIRTRKPLSEETKLKLSIAAKKQWDRQNQMSA
jgi:group I intron endonuclease